MYLYFPCNSPRSGRRWLAPLAECKPSLGHLGMVDGGSRISRISSFCVLAPKVPLDARCAKSHPDLPAVCVRFHHVCSPVCSPVPTLWEAVLIGPGDAHWRRPSYQKLGPSKSDNISMFICSLRARYLALDGIACSQPPNRQPTSRHHGCHMVCSQRRREGLPISQIFFERPPGPIPPEEASSGAFSKNWVDNTPLAVARQQPPVIVI